jgi:hypothetical protein
MARQYKGSRGHKAIVGVILAAFGFAIVFQGLDNVAAKGCNLIDMTAWMALEGLRSVILACYQALPAYLCDDRGLLVGFLHMLVSRWPLLCVMVGGA